MLLLVSLLLILSQPEPVKAGKPNLKKLWVMVEESVLMVNLDSLMKNKKRTDIVYVARCFG